MQIFKEELSKLSKERLIEYIIMAGKDFWTLQGNWMLNVEKKFGNEVAVELDGICYGRAAEVGAYRLMKFYNLDNSMGSLVKVYTLLPWMFYINPEWIEVSEKKAVRRISSCPMQLDRIKAGLDELPCKRALYESAGKVANAVNPNIKVTNVIAPPDKHSECLWCEITFELME